MLKQTLAALRARRDSQRGFTLIELIIVIAIIGILVAIAIPVYGNIQLSARKSTVEASAKNGLSLAKAWTARDTNGVATSEIEGNINKLTTSKVYVQGVLIPTADFSTVMCVAASWKDSPAQNTHLDRSGVSTVYYITNVNGKVTKAQWDSICVNDAA